MMNAPSKPTTPDRLLGLLIATGFMLVIFAIPLGALFSLQAHYKFHSDWYWALVEGSLMAAAMITVGVMLTAIGERIVQRRGKKCQSTIQNDSA